MLYALVNDERTKPSPGIMGVCPCCRSSVLAKCGQIKTWHWSHVSTDDCDEWWEPESDWHSEWKGMFPESFQEVVVGNHRADVRGVTGFVLELQHSSIDPDTISIRELFYDRMAWLFDGREIYDNFSFRHRTSDYGRKYVSFRWKHPRRSWITCRKKLYIDFGFDVLLQVEQVFNKIPCGGWGYWVSRDDFMKQMNCLMGRSAFELDVLFKHKLLHRESSKMAIEA